ncbi:MAG: hypothetical protein WCJ88_01525 [Actinomycetes bacterium]
MSERRNVIVTGERRFPAKVAAELSRRHRSMLSNAQGRVLDLSDPAAREVVRTALDRGRTADDDQWDLVVSVGELIRFPDLPATLAAIDSLIAPGGRLLAVEPVARPGIVRVIASSMWSPSRWVRRFHLGRDLPAATRTTSLTNDDIDRFIIPTAVVPLRHFVAIGARRAEPSREVVR